MSFPRHEPRYMIRDRKRGLQTIFQRLSNLTFEEGVQ